MNYEEFLQSKMRTAESVGFEVPEDGLNVNLFQFQKKIVAWALRKGRAALFLDTGLGKTICQLAWADEVARHTGGDVLILAPLAVSAQTAREAARFGLEVNICRSGGDVKAGINITNYETLDSFDCSKFAGVVLDESSILKSYMGVRKRNIITSFENTQYKLSCTATPAPNNEMEILNQAEFLGVMKSHEALAIWFINDTSSSGNYTVKGHARESFWEWTSTWAVCISRPSDIGFSDEGYILPPLLENEVIAVVSELADNLEDGFFRKIDMNATSFYKESRLTCGKRAEMCAEIVYQTAEQYMVWCNTDYEADALKKLIPDSLEVRGSHSAAFKEQAALDFIDGKIRVLISKAKIFGYGLNFQNCHNAVFCGLNYSYESYYQTVRRFWRFGQSETVNVYIVIGSTEQEILAVIREKEERQQRMKAGMYGNLKKIQNLDIKGSSLNYQ
jgi:superfamily II DNA or RNA helicase